MRQLIPALALFTVATLAAHARADASPEVLAVDVGGVPAGRPQLAVTVAGARPGAVFTLRDAASPPGTAVQPLVARSWAEGDDAIAIAIVYNGQEVYIGNERITTEDDPSRYIGVYAGLRHALDELGARRVPAGSEVSLISYAQGAMHPVPTRPLWQLSGDAIGSERDYYGRFGTDLIAGIDDGIRTLEAARTPLRALIVIGDGNDTNNEAAKQALVELKRRAARDGISTFAVIYKGMLSDPGQVITAMIPGAHTINTMDDVGAAIDGFLSRITDRVYLRFAPEELGWDGHAHAFVLRADNADVDTVMAEVPYRGSATPWYRTGYVLQLLAGFAAMLVVAAAMRLTFRWRDPV